MTCSGGSISLQTPDKNSICKGISLGKQEMKLSFKRWWSVNDFLTLRDLKFQEFQHSCHYMSRKYNLDQHRVRLREIRNISTVKRLKYSVRHATYHWTSPLLVLFTVWEV